MLNLIQPSGTINIEGSSTLLYSTVNPLIKDTPKEEKPPNKGHTPKEPLKEDSLSAKDKMLGSDCVHYIYYLEV